MEPQRRTIDTPFHTRRQSKTLCLEKTTLRRRDYVQTVGLNAETKKDRHRAEGEIFVLTFPLIGRSNSWAECRDKKGPASSRRGNICLDISFNRTFPVCVNIMTVHATRDSG